MLQNRRTIQKARPELVTHIRNLQEYDIIFIGFPNWWYDMPMPIYSFFDEYDFTGKTLIPFCTHAGTARQADMQSSRNTQSGA